MSKLVWDKEGTRYYESGIDQGVIYTVPQNGSYTKGEAWSGLISVTISPSGAEPTALWADNMKYVEMRSAEEVGGTIEAYTYPKSFAACNGEVEAATGVNIGQQDRKPFAMCYRSFIGNDTDGNKAAYKLHIIYGMKCSPSEIANSTINDSPEAKTMSWEFNTTPVKMSTGSNLNAVSHIEISSLDANPEKLAALEKMLYGSEDTEASLPAPEELINMMKVDEAN